MRKPQTRRIRIGCLRDNKTLIQDLYKGHEDGFIHWSNGDLLMSPPQPTQSNWISPSSYQLLLAPQVLNSYVLQRSCANNHSCFWAQGYNNHAMPRGQLFLGLEWMRYVYGWALTSAYLQLQEIQSVRLVPGSGAEYHGDGGGSSPYDRQKAEKMEGLKTNITFKGTSLAQGLTSSN